VALILLLLILFSEFILLQNKPKFKKRGRGYLKNYDKTHRK